jgi:hypothetical protein
MFIPLKLIGFDTHPYMVYSGYDYNLVWFVNLLKTKRPTLEVKCESTGYGPMAIGKSLCLANWEIESSNISQS